MVDSDIELFIGTVIRPRPDPVLIDSSTGKVGFWKIGHQLLRHGVNEIPRSLIGRARTGISGEVIEGDKCGTRYRAIEGSGIWIPDLAGRHAAQPGIIECPSLRPTHLAKITTPHRVAGNGSSSGAQARCTRV